MRAGARGGDLVWIFGVMGVEGALDQSGRASREVSGFPRSPGVKRNYARTSYGQSANRIIWHYFYMTPQHDFGGASGAVLLDPWLLSDPSAAEPPGPT